VVTDDAREQAQADLQATLERLLRAPEPGGAPMIDTPAPLDREVNALQVSLVMAREPEDIVGPLEALFWIFEHERLVSDEHLALTAQSIWAAWEPFQTAYLLSPDEIEAIVDKSHGPRP
jgi:hypothetical protein